MTLPIRVGVVLLWSVSSASLASDELGPTDLAANEAVALEYYRALAHLRVAREDHARARTALRETPESQQRYLDQPKTLIGVGFTDTGPTIAYVHPGSPADDAGLASGDVIVGIDDVKIDPSDEAARETVQWAIRRLEPGAPLPPLEYGGITPSSV